VFPRAPGHHGVARLAVFHRDVDGAGRARRIDLGEGDVDAGGGEPVEGLAAEVVVADAGGEGDVRPERGEVVGDVGRGADPR